MIQQPTGTQTLSFGGHIGSRVIAEGVETEVESRALSELGVQYGQGFHLGMPVMRTPPPHAADVVAVDATWFGDQTVLGFTTGAPPQKTSIHRAYGAHASSISPHTSRT